MKELKMQSHLDSFEKILKPSYWSYIFSGDSDVEKRLPKEKLYAMCRYEGVHKWIRRSDYAFYQSLVEVLIPDVLRPIPGSLTQAIRNFAKSLEGWLKNAMRGVPEEMMKTKVRTS